MKTTIQKTLTAAVLAATLLFTAGCPEEKKADVPSAAGVMGNIEDAKALVDKRASVSSAAATQIQTQVKTLPPTPVTTAIDKQAGLIVSINGAPKPEDALAAKERDNLILQGKVQEAEAKYAALYSQGEQEKALLATKLKDAQDEAKSAKAALELQAKIDQAERTSTKWTNAGIFLFLAGALGAAACFLLKIGPQGLLASGLLALAGIIACVGGQLVTNEYFMAAVAVVVLLSLIGGIYGGIAIFMSRRRAEAARLASLEHVTALEEENALHKVTLAKVVDTVDTLMPKKSGTSVDEKTFRAALQGSMDQKHMDAITALQVAIKRKKVIASV